MSYFPGATFGLLCLKIATSLVMLFTLDIDLTKQLATENATRVWLAALPAYWLALLLLYLFYTQCHVWKSEGIVVGFKYEDDAVTLYDRNFKGSWVSHSIDDSPIDESEDFSMIPLHVTSYQPDTQEATAPLLSEPSTPDSPSQKNSVTDQAAEL